MESTGTLTPSVIEDLRAQAKESLYFFAKGVLGYTWLDKEIHLPICKLLEDEGTTRLKFTLPRGWYKTTLVSIAYPVWKAIKNPDVRILLVQNTITNAVAKLRAIDGIFKTNDLFRVLFPELLPTKECVWRTDSMCVPRKRQAVESTFEAAGTRTKIVSRHYDEIIEDDTVAPDQDQMTSETVTPSKEDIEQAIGFHRLLTPILVDQTSRSIVVGTRWYERDLLSWIEENQKSYTSYTRACREWRDGVLTPVFPDRFGEARLDQIKEDMGVYLFSCLYMNEPIRTEDMIFRKEWFVYYDALPIDDLLYYTHVDPAGDPEQSKRKNSAKKTDWNVVITTALHVRTGNVFVVEITRQKCNVSVLLDILFRHCRLYRPIKVGIETIAYQQTLIHLVARRQVEEKMWLNVEPLTHGGVNKNKRIVGLQPLFASGRLRIKESMKDLQAELEAFPLAQHDDLSDCLAMGLELWGLSYGDETPAKPEPTSVVPDEVELIRKRNTPDPSADIYVEYFQKSGKHAWN